MFHDCFTDKDGRSVGHVHVYQNDAAFCGVMALCPFVKQEPFLDLMKCVHHHICVVNDVIYDEKIILLTFSLNLRCILGFRSHVLLLG